MIGEWLTQLTTPCPEPYRAMGYLKELIAIKYRHQRCQTVWAPHLTNCQNLITTAADNCETKRRAVVLGSGLLLDIPIAHLAHTFETVVLIDICHLRETKTRVRKFPNVHLVNGDISGAVQPLKRWLSGNRKDPLPTPDIDRTYLNEADYVISSNLLAQLPLMPVVHLQQQTPTISPNALNDFARSIIDHHLSLLQSLGSPVTLISETLRLITEQDRPVSKIDPLLGAPLNYTGEEWWWDIAPIPEFRPDADIKLHIRGISNLSAATPARYCRNTNEGDG
jgi:hypothetical protein